MPKTNQEKMSLAVLNELLRRAQQNHIQHYSAHFEEPRIVGWNIKAKCLTCNEFRVATGGNLKRHVCQGQEQNIVPINQQLPPNPPETEPTIAELKEENRQLRAQLQGLEIIPELQEEIRQLRAQLQEIRSSTNITASSVPPSSSSTTSPDEGPEECSSVLETTVVRKGFCLIINMENFSVDVHSTTRLCEKRAGSEEDVKKVENTFNSLGSLVRIKRDLKFDEVIAEIEYLQHKIDWDLYDHLVVTIMSHGNSDRFTTSDCRRYGTEEFVEAFGGKRFPGLLGKPKIFFLNFCRGEKANEIASMERKSKQGVTIPRAIPASSEFFLAWACMPGYKAYRNPGKNEPSRIGSYFIQEVCSVIETFHGTYPLTDLMTMVTENVSAINIEREGLQYSQVPGFNTCLTRKVRFGTCVP